MILFSSILFFILCIIKPFTIQSQNTTNCLVPDGDRMVGISAFYDVSCSEGGIGCRGVDNCRFCKNIETIQSSNFLPCPSIPCDNDTITCSNGIVVGRNISNNCLFNECPLILTSNMSTILYNNSIICSTGEADQVNGIYMYKDVQCLYDSGNIGCNAGLPGCRYCEIKNVSNKTIYPSCPLNVTIPTPKPTIPVYPDNYNNTNSSLCVTSIGDQSVGVGMYYDYFCVNNGGLGCDIDKPFCRYCKLFNSPQSNSFLECPGYTNTSNNTNTIIGNSTKKPIPTAMNCTSSYGDKQVGIYMYFDNLCISQDGGIGCDTALYGCRYCKAFNTTNSNHLLQCPEGITPVTALNQNVETHTNTIGKTNTITFIALLIAGCCITVLLLAIFIYRKNGKKNNKNTFGEVIPIHDHDTNQLNNDTNDTHHSQKMKENVETNEIDIQL